MRHAEPGGQVQAAGEVAQSGAPRGVVPDGRRRAQPFVVAAPRDSTMNPGTEASAVVVLTPPVNAQNVRRGPCPSPSARSPPWTPNARWPRKATSRSAASRTCRPTSRPSRPTAAWSGRHTLTLTNRGNAVVSLRLSARATTTRRARLPDTTEQVLVPVGGGRDGSAAGPARSPFLRGAPVRRPFRVLGEPDPSCSTAPSERPIRSVRCSTARFNSYPSCPGERSCSVPCSSRRSRTGHGRRRRRRRSRRPKGGHPAGTADRAGRRGGRTGFGPAALAADRPRRALRARRAGGRGGPGVLEGAVRCQTAPPRSP